MSNPPPPSPSPPGVYEKRKVPPSPQEVVDRNPRARSNSIAPASIRSEPMAGRGSLSSRFRDPYEGMRGRSSTSALSMNAPYTRLPSQSDLSAGSGLPRNRSTFLSSNPAHTSSKSNLNPPPRALAVRKPPHTGRNSLSFVSVNEDLDAPASVNEETSAPNSLLSRKQLTDQLKSIHEAISVLQASEALVRQEVTALVKANYATGNALEKSDELVKQLKAKVDSQREVQANLEDTILEQQDVIASLQAGMKELYELVNEGGQNSNAQVESQARTIVKGAAAADKRREIMVHGVARAVLKELMGIQGTVEMVPSPLENGKFWTSDDPTAPDRRLRPSWDHWQPNASSWLEEVLAVASQRGETYYEVPRGIDSAAFFASITAVEIKASVKQYWTSLSKKWSDSKKDDTKRRQDTSAGRHRTRRSKKAERRTVHRDKVPELMDPDKDFMFDPRYQSDDVTQDEDEPEGLRAGTLEIDSDDPIGQRTQKQLTKPSGRKKPSSKPWLNHKPLYRSAEINTLFTRLQPFVDADSGARHPVQASYPVDTPLPKRGPNDKATHIIARHHIDPDWLKTHSQQNTSKYIRAECEPTHEGNLAQGGYPAQYTFSGEDLPNDGEGGDDITWEGGQWEIGEVGDNEAGDDELDPDLVPHVSLVPPDDLEDMYY
ncbi:hypothetical protein BDY19DRAFT_990498 [Irpex rosettiformis]|uniref:Uncharacterized protein n=1 Tax=Irpex rosettiformis TaxID=378272 RepID=A0ACB8UES3_9APHY|nr:hypothetical protein BDY19DRAFT_990498 [Irpex rosettiformis]